MTDIGRLTAEEVIGLLDLAPHPEGGHYRETFRDSACDGTGRAFSTAIYFLLAEGEASHWHRVDAVETWFWHAGAPLRLNLSADGTRVESVRLGPDLRAGEVPQATVGTGEWQAAESLGEWTLVSCTVAPGFTFEGFELAAPGWMPGAWPATDANAACECGYGEEVARPGGFEPPTP